MQLSLLIEPRAVSAGPTPGILPQGGGEEDGAFATLMALPETAEKPVETPAAGDVPLPAAMLWPAVPVPSAPVATATVPSGSGSEAETVALAGSAPTDALPRSVTVLALPTMGALGEERSDSSVAAGQDGARPNPDAAPRSVDGVTDASGFPGPAEATPVAANVAGVAPQDTGQGARTGGASPGHVADERGSQPLSDPLAESGVTVSAPSHWPMPVFAGSGSGGWVPAPSAPEVAAPDPSAQRQAGSLPFPTAADLRVPLGPVLGGSDPIEHLPGPAAPQTLALAGQVPPPAGPETAEVAPPSGLAPLPDPTLHAPSAAERLWLGAQLVAAQPAPGAGVWVPDETGIPRRDVRSTASGAEPVTGKPQPTEETSAARQKREILAALSGVASQPLPTITMPERWSVLPHGGPPAPSAPNAVPVVAATMLSPGLAPAMPLAFLAQAMASAGQEVWVDPSFAGQGDSFAPGLASVPCHVTGPGASAPVSAVPRLAEAMVAMVSGQGDGRTEIALAPEELGKVRLQLQTDAQNPDRMIVILTFERPETMDLFRRHAADLTETLRAAGYGDTRLDFGQSGTGSGHGAGLMDFTARDEGGQAKDAGPTRHRPEEGSAPPGHRATGSLDIRL